MASAKRAYSDTLAAHGEEMVTVPRHTPKQCTECGAKSTPQWRQGPQGPQTLCNACGVRYSRLHRKAKAPKKSANDSPTAHKDEVVPRAEEDEQQDSEGLTTFHAHIHNNAQPSPRAMAVVRGPPTLNPSSPSVTRTSRSVRTELPFLQPCSPSSAVTNTPNSHKLPPGRTSLAPLSRVTPRAAVPRMAAPTSMASDYDVECEAANMLLSLHAAGDLQGQQAAAGKVKKEPAAQAGAPGAPVQGAVPAQQPAPAARVQAQQAPAPVCGPAPASFEMLLAAQGSCAPGLQNTELRALQQLCGIFDERFKELVAAQVACSAVEQVLRVKQEEARLAQLAARSAAQLLMQHATQLVNHDAVQRALAAHAAKLEAVQETAEGKAALAVLTAEDPAPSNEAAGSQASNDH